MMTSYRRVVHYYMVSTFFLAQVGIHESGETVTVPPNITLASCICCGMTYDVKVLHFLHYSKIYNTKD